MSLEIKIECLPEPSLIFGSGKIGVDPRSMMARFGAADKSPGRDIQIGLVGASAEIDMARFVTPNYSAGETKIVSEMLPLGTLAASPGRYHLVH